MPTSVNWFVSLNSLATVMVATITSSWAIPKIKQNAIKCNANDLMRTLYHHLPI
ncbi:hypothetical protein M1N93_01930 [Dehalococcoidia bacterium]|nr:hypothetical protein [Dehalococcoidia bacterium]